jgi:voltage-gated potassium channel
MTTARPEALARWEKRSSFAIAMAALAPILLSLGHSTDAAWVLVALASWAVFLVDLVVRVRLAPGYLRTGWGRFDLAIVVITAPWFLIPGLGASRFIGLARLARLARVVIASHGLRRLVTRLNRVAIFGALMLASCAFVVTEAEGPANGFDNYGDGLWWGIVTLTTVGYGDLVPVTVIGRLTAAVLMISGIGIVGVLAGTLASFFHLDTDTAASPGAGGTTGGGAPVEALTEQVAALNDRVAALVERLEGRGPAGGPP